MTIGWVLILALSAGPLQKSTPAAANPPAPTVTTTANPPAPAASSNQAPATLSLEEAWKKARVGGKYRFLLRQFKAAEDRAKEGDFKDRGRDERPQYAGQADLPAGFWVYVYPYWYIWRDETASPRAKASYAPEQALGPPDALYGGDTPQSWASQTPDGQREWLTVEYAEPLAATALKVYETCATGALTRMTAFKLDGAEVEVWKGKDPTPAGRQQGVSIIPVKMDFKAAQFKMYVNSPAVPSWNEIDAVGLVAAGDASKTHWAVAAAASSVFGQAQYSNTMIMTSSGPFPGGYPVSVPQPDQEIKRLQAEVKKLQDVVKELESLKKEVAEIKQLRTDLQKLLQAVAKEPPAKQTTK